MPEGGRAGRRERVDDRDGWEGEGGWLPSCALCSAFRTKEGRLPSADRYISSLLSFLLLSSPSNPSFLPPPYPACPLRLEPEEAG